MPELPEVETTTRGVRARTLGLTIKEAWSDYNSQYYKGSETIRDTVYFKSFKKEIEGKKIISVERRAKNILIGLNSGKTILIHLKMTGHLLYGNYEFIKEEKRFPWKPIAPKGLLDPFNKHIHFMLTLSNGKRLALSDTRKFAKVTLLETSNLHESSHLKDIGPEPLDKSFTFEKFNERIEKRPHVKVKLVIMDQTIMAGVGNIYADESLFLASVHPTRTIKSLSKDERRKLFLSIKKVLLGGIDFGGDSMSDYRNIDGEKGKFQENHNAYRRTGKHCPKPGCKGVIKRMVVGGRGTHFCPVHQK